jgi:hypothetical protein
VAKDVYTLEAELSHFSESQEVRLVVDGVEIENFSIEQDCCGDPVINIELTN